MSQSSMVDAIVSLAHKHGLDDLVPQLLLSVRLAVHLTKSDSRVTAETVESRFGGVPDVLPDFNWPRWQGRPLGFLAQIRCDEVSSLLRGEGQSPVTLPDTGVLSFFYDFVEQPWGFDPADRGGGVVVYTPEHVGLVPAILPDDAKWPVGQDDPNEYTVLASHRMGFTLVSTVPAIDSLAFGRFDRDDSIWEHYCAFFDDVRQLNTGDEPSHQFFGHSDNIQGDMQLECQLVTHGLFAGDESGYNDPRRSELEPGADEWQLLFQFDSDDDLDIMWGDAGMLYFWIRESDLLSCNFDKAWTILQCG